MSQPQIPQSPESGLPLHIKVLIGFLPGGIVGLLVSQNGLEQSALVATFTSYLAKPFGQIFLNVLFMLVVPLMLSALVLDVAELGDIASLGRLGGKTLIYTAVVTGIAVAIGPAMVNLIQPGQHLDPALVERAMAEYATKASDIAARDQDLDFMSLLANIVPHNVIAADAG